MYKVLVVVAVVIGVATGAPQGRIIGGEDAKEGQFNYHVFLKRGGEYACGATILNEDYIVTAAHCVQKPGGEPYDPKAFEVIAGTLKPDGDDAETREVGEVIVHEDYDGFTNDIALLKLKETFVLGENIGSVEIYDEEEKVPDASPIEIIGFGHVDKEGKEADTLKFTTLSLLPDKKCGQVTELDTKGIICLEHEEDKGICNGDSGSPAIFGEKLVGVASFMFGNCDTTYPDGYTYVPAFKKWIDEKMAVET